MQHTIGSVVHPSSSLAMGPVDLTSRSALNLSLIPAVEDMIARATAWQSTVDGRTSLLEALQRLFKAYDISESGKVSCSDFVKLEIRNGLDQGDPRRILQAFPKMLRADSSSSGMLNFLDFCAAQLAPPEQEGVTCQHSGQTLL